MTTENATANLNIEDLNCPIFSSEDDITFQRFSLWVEGILCCLIAVPGFFGNIGSSFVLLQKDMRNSFNLLLIALACFDNVYLFGGILEAFRKHFNLVTKVHIILFPYLLYPFQTMAMTGSILMTVAIALERYVAVHYPINYSQSMNDSFALRQRMMKYLLPVFCLTVLFNVTKFFEATYEDEIVVVDMFIDGIHLNHTQLFPVLKPTELRTDPNYSIYFNWFRFVVIGVIPFGLLVLFNTKIYADIKERQRRSAGFKRPQPSATICRPAGSVYTTATPLTTAKGVDGSNLNHSGSIEIRKAITDDEKTVLVIGSQGEDAIEGSPSGSSSSTLSIRNARLHSNGSSFKGLTTADDTEMVESPNVNKKKSANLEVVAISPTPKRLTESDSSNFTKRTVQRLLSTGSSLRSSTNKMAESIEMTATNQNVGINNQSEEKSSFIATRGGCNLSSFLKKQPPASQAVLGQDTSVTISVNARRRYMEDHLASIFMMYILVFLICHFPRIMLNIYELAVIRKAVECISHGQQPFPEWANYLTCISHILLVINSSINIIIYCALSSKFREESARIFKTIYAKCKDSPHHI